MDHDRFENPDGHENIKSSTHFQEDEFQADFYTLGKHRISGSLLRDQTIDSVPLIEAQTKQELPEGTLSEFTSKGLIVYPSEEAKLSPQLGDIRYVYTTSNVETIGVIGTQVGDLLYGGTYKSSKRRSLFRVGSYDSPQEVIDNWTTELVEGANDLMYVSLFFVFLSMLFLNGLLKERLATATLFRAFLSLPSFFSALINTAWVSALLFWICHQYNDFSQAPKLVPAIFFGFMLLFVGWVKGFGKKIEHLRELK